MQDWNPAAHGQKIIYKKYRPMVHFTRYNKMSMTGNRTVLQGLVYKDKTIAFEAFELHLKHFLEDISPLFLFHRIFFENVLLESSQTSVNRKRKPLVYKHNNDRLWVGRS